MEYSQNATLVFISAYAIYVFLGKIRTPHALHSGTLLLRNNDTAVNTIVSTAVSDLANNANFNRNSLRGAVSVQRGCIF